MPASSASPSDWDQIVAEGKVSQPAGASERADSPSPMLLPCHGTRIELSVALEDPACVVASAPPRDRTGLDRLEVKMHLPATVRAGDTVPVRVSITNPLPRPVELSFVVPKQRTVCSEPTPCSTKGFNLQVKDSRDRHVLFPRNVGILGMLRQSQSIVRLGLAAGGVAHAQLTWRVVGYDQDRDYPALNDAPPLEPGRYQITLQSPLTGVKIPRATVRVRR